MLRYFAGVGSALLLIAAGFFIWKGWAQREASPIPEAPLESAAAQEGGGGTPSQPPSADERTREQRRFDRADRDNDGRVTLEEMTYARRRAYARLDVNHDGHLSFDEWAVRTLTKFSTADANHDRALDRPEFATTAPPRRQPPRRPNCDCSRAAPAAPAAPAAGDEEDSN
ncbi:MAG TPA: EF-hand domain-containing protein [Allosphingosinicella sp.]